MTLNEFNELENKVGKDEFNREYKNINTVMFLLSIFGHIASIFLAYFLVSTIISTAIENYYVTMIVTIILLIGLESLKREIFDKFSMMYLKTKDMFSKRILPLLISSFIVISLSFYATVSGSKEFSSKEKEIVEKYDDKLESYKTKVDSIYKSDIDKLKVQIEDNKKRIVEKDDEQTRIESGEKINSSNRRRVNDLKDEKKVLSTEIDNIYIKIDEFEQKKKKDILEYEKELDGKKSKDTNNNSRNTLFFILLSTIIELLIIVGVYFNKYFIFRSYNEEKERLYKSPNYQNFKLYSSILDIIYTNDTMINDKLPSSKSIIEMCKINNLIILKKDVDNMFKLLNNLGVIRSSGSVKYFNREKDMSIDQLKKYFKIK